MAMLDKQFGTMISAALIVGVLPLTLGTKSAQAANIVNNGSFESPAINSGSFQFFASIPGWSLLPGSNSLIEVQNNVAGSPFDGNQFVELDSSGTTGIYQDLNTQVGQKYKLEYAFSPRPGVPQNILNVKWGNNLVLALNQSGTNLTDTNWLTLAQEVVATNPITRLSFDNLNETSDGLGTYIDKVSVTSVPEPLTVGGSLIALSFGLMMKRKKIAS